MAGCLPDGPNKGQFLCSTTSNKAGKMSRHVNQDVDPAAVVGYYASSLCFPSGLVPSSSWQFHPRYIDEADASQARSSVHLPKERDNRVTGPFRQQLCHSASCIEPHYAGQRTNHFQWHGCDRQKRKPDIFYGRLLFETHESILIVSLERQVIACTCGYHPQGGYQPDAKSGPSIC